MSDSDKVCKVINCENYSDCVCAFCDCLEKAYNKGRVDTEAEWKSLPNSYADRLAEQSYQRGYKNACRALIERIRTDEFVRRVVRSQESLQDILVEIIVAQMKGEE